MRALPFSDLHIIGQKVRKATMLSNGAPVKRRCEKQFKIYENAAKTTGT